MLLAGSSNTHDEKTPSRGSSVQGAALNFTNTIVGAGCIGLGNAMARSGGLISIATILFFAILTKLSFDLVIVLSVETEGALGSYEQLGQIAYGIPGRIAVMISKFLCSFGGLVVYIKIVKDNFASDLRDFTKQDYNQDFVTLLHSASVVLPFCLLRDMTHLERVSIIKIFVLVSILSTITYLYVTNPGGTVRITGGSTNSK